MSGIQVSIQQTSRMDFWISGCSLPVPKFWMSDINLAAPCYLSLCANHSPISTVAAAHTALLIFSKILHIQAEISFCWIFSCALGSFPFREETVNNQCSANGKRFFSENTWFPFQCCFYGNKESIQEIHDTNIPVFTFPVLLLHRDVVSYISKIDCVLNWSVCFANNIFHSAKW